MNQKERKTHHWNQAAKKDLVLATTRIAEVNTFT